MLFSQEESDARIHTACWITPSLWLLCISGVFVSQHSSRRMAVISGTVFDFDIMFAALTTTVLAVEQLHANRPVLFNSSLCWQL